MMSNYGYRYMSASELKPKEKTFNEWLSWMFPGENCDNLTETELQELQEIYKKYELGKC